MFFLYASLCLGALIFSYLLVPETKLIRNWRSRSAALRFFVTAPSPTSVVPESAGDGADGAGAGARAGAQHRPPKGAADRAP